MAEISHLRPVESRTGTLDENSAAIGAIHDALAILDAIGQGGLFDSLPEAESDRRRHQTGMVLLQLVEEKLRQVAIDLPT